MKYKITPKQTKMLAVCVVEFTAKSGDLVTSQRNNAAPKAGRCRKTGSFKLILALLK